MALSWTQDRLGPLCRYAEDCALVMSVIAKPDGRDLSVSELPFNWNSRFDIQKLRVGYLKDAFDETRDPVAKKNDEKAMAADSGAGREADSDQGARWTSRPRRLQRGIGGVLR